MLVMSLETKMFFFNKPYNQFSKTEFQRRIGCIPVHVQWLLNMARVLHHKTTDKDIHP